MLFALALCKQSPKLTRRKVDKLRANMAAKKGAREGAARGRSLCLWRGLADQLFVRPDPNNLKPTKINYENFHFTSEFLVTCNFVNIMRLFGVQNLIMKMSHISAK